jgi:hypothetical protein
MDGTYSIYIVFAIPQRERARMAAVVDDHTLDERARALVVAVS